MVLARLRDSARLITFVLLASFWGLLHRDSDDGCVLPAFEAHDESRHVVGAPADGEPDHCAICHSIRTPRRPFGPVAQLQSPLTVGGLVVPGDHRSHRPPALGRIPARAPPATLS